jgi:putative hemolysin
MKRPLVALSLLFLIALAAAVLPTTQSVQAGNTSASTSAVAGPLGEAGKYCVNHGGEVDNRKPYFNTNDSEQNWFALAGDRQFCKFTNKDTSRIHVLLSTLYSDKPTLAALAYYAKVPYGGSCAGNPASCYCSQLGGTDLFGGINLNGGGWVMKSDPVDTVLEACIFPDMSTIDSWGLTYHQAGIIRGRNLDKVLRYPNPYSSGASSPASFPGSSSR